MFDDDPRWGNDSRERDVDSRERDAVDPQDVFVEKLDLPRGPDVNWSAIVTASTPFAVLNSER